MLEIDNSRAPAPIIAEHIQSDGTGRQLIGAFMKLVAAYLLLQTIDCWMRVVGLADGPPNRFDTMAPHWQLLIAFLCVAQPVAALGLWIGHSWGLVIWVIMALAEVYLFTVQSELYGVQYWTLIINVVLLAIILLLEISKRIIPNKRLTRLNTNP